LDTPDAPRIREIERLSNSSPDYFASKFGSSQVEFPMGNVFWTCANIFSNKAAGKAAASVGTKRIFLFTNEDNPHAASPALQRAAKTRGRDLIDLGITIELFAIPKKAESGVKFNVAAFYRSIIPDILDFDDDEDNPDAQRTSDSNVNIEKFEELLAKVRRKENRERALAKTILSLGPEMDLSIKL
jgi:ATP-dependent DNA helicase 2 subunit 1